MADVCINKTTKLPKLSVTCPRKCVPVCEACYTCRRTGAPHAADGTAGPGPGPSPAGSPPGTGTLPHCAAPPHPSHPGATREDISSYEKFNSKNFNVSYTVCSILIYFNQHKIHLAFTHVWFSSFSLNFDFTNCLFCIAFIKNNMSNKFWEVPTFDENKYIVLQFSKIILNQPSIPVRYRRRPSRWRRSWRPHVCVTVSTSSHVQQLVGKTCRLYIPCLSF